MCPLRIILIFLSATLAGFFVLRNLKSPTKLDDSTSDSSNDSLFESSSISSPPSSIPRSSKVWAAIGSGFWTCVDMASGRYLWRNLVSSSKPLKSPILASN